MVLFATVIFQMDLFAPGLFLCWNGANVGVELIIEDQRSRERFVVVRGVCKPLASRLIPHGEQARGKPAGKEDSPVSFPVPETGRLPLMEKQDLSFACSVLPERE